MPPSPPHDDKSPRPAATAPGGARSRRAPLDVYFPPKDRPLANDVRALGALLGDVLREQGGDDLFERVETARLLARRRRSGDDMADAELAEHLSALEPTDAADTVRAFSAYFGLVNLAEQVHRIRRRRHHLMSEATQTGSVEWVLRSLQGRGLDADRARELLATMSLEPVFTAHPTEAVRRTLLIKEQRLARALVEHMERGKMPPREHSALLARMRSEVTVSWQTNEHATLGPMVSDEVDHVLFYLSDVIYRVVPSFYQAFDDAMELVYGVQATPTPRPRLRFGSWVGGDMDGNPNVGPETIRSTLARHRHVVVGNYRSEARELGDRLSQSLSRIPADPAVLERVHAYQRLAPQHYERIPVRYRDMPYRVLLRLVEARLSLLDSDSPGGYERASELRADLQLVRDSLRHHAGEHAGLFWVDRFLRRVETFGFHLATLDVRQDSEVHRRVIAELLGDPDFPERPASERRSRIEAALSASSPPAAREPVSDETRRALDVMRAIAEGRASYGNDAIGPYIISMAQGADDVLAVLLIARAGGLVDSDGHIPLDVAPLFETVPDLERGPQSLRTMLGDPLYRSHVASRRGIQMVMLGYSDSSKDAGLAASRWALHEAQRSLVAAAGEFSVELTLFHGRGGTVSRGGGKTREAILAQPPGSVRGRLRLTEQGEIIHSKFGLRGIASRTLELMAGAVLESGFDEGRPATTPEAWREAMECIARNGRATYRAMMHDDPELYAYFRLATPIDVIERLRIGSRPASRRHQRGISDLRAIPWVFAWTQCRSILPGWYGVGAGLQAAVDELGVSRLQDMARQWPFFHNLLSDVEMVLSKADLAIAQRYSELAGPLHEKFFPRILAEFERTKSVVCTVSQTSELLEKEPVLRRSIRLRNPYVDPMSFLQLDLLQRWRATDREDPNLERALFTTVKGIARGLQNTG